MCALKNHIPLSFLEIESTPGLVSAELVDASPSSTSSTIIQSSSTSCSSCGAIFSSLDRFRSLAELCVDGLLVLRDGVVVTKSSSEAWLLCESAYLILERKCLLMIDCLDGELLGAADGASSLDELS